MGARGTAGHTAIAEKSLFGWLDRDFVHEEVWFGQPKKSNL